MLFRSHHETKAAYPIPVIGHAQAIGNILDYYEPKNLFGVGRWGQHQYQNADVSMFEAIKFVNSQVGPNNDKFKLESIIEKSTSGKDKFYFISPFGLVDTLMLCGLQKAFEAQNNSKIHFIIKHSHEIVMKLYNIKDYTIVSMKSAWPYKNPLLSKLATENPSPQKKSLIF